VLETGPTLSDVCEAIVDCEHKTAPTVAFGIPSVRTANIKNGRIDFPGCNCVSEATYRQWTQRLEPRPGDLILAREAPVGEVGMVPPGQGACLGQRTVLIRPAADRVVPRFLLFLLVAPEMQHELLSRAEGSTVSHLNMSDIRALRLPPLPPLPEQRRIAHILGTLDDKIELNRRMNETLEAMAQALFKSWFVDFDPVFDNALAAGNLTPAVFADRAAQRAAIRDQHPPLPDHLLALFPDRFQDSPLGPIPEGWEAVPTPTVIEFNPRIKLVKGKVTKYADMKAVPTSGPCVSGVAEREYKGGAKFQQGDVLMARITPCLENGKTALVDFLADDEVAHGSTEFIVMRGRGAVSQEFAYCLARSPEFRERSIASMVGSSGRQRVQVSAYDQHQLPRPPDELHEAFGRQVRPFFKRITANARESAALALVRDTLLPLLASGAMPPHCLPGI